MLRSAKDLENYAIGATNGAIGHVKDFYFDDEAWVIRYFVVDTGTWLSSRKVLISPIAIGHPNWPEKILPVALTKEQVKNSPDIDTEKPVSRQHEIQYLGYYGYPNYWGGVGLWGDDIYPGMMVLSVDSMALVTDAMQTEQQRDAGARDEHDDPHLRSCNELIGYHILATDGEIGHVQGFLIDEETWAIRYIIVDTSNWWLGHQVLIAPQWIDAVRWADSTVAVNLTQQAIRDAPSYDPGLPLDRGQEMSIHEHYGRSGYWTNEAKREAVTPEEK